MKSSFSALFGFTIAAVSHLAVIPVLALYGVGVCPVLRGFGFGFGCAYTSALVFFVVGWDLLASFAIWAVTRRKAELVKHFAAFSMLAHTVGFAAGSVGLRLYLSGLDVPEPTLDRMSTALFYTAILLVVLQGQIFDWLSYLWVKAMGMRPGHDAVQAANPNKHFILRWAFDSAWTAVPYAAVVIIGTGVLYHKLMALLEEEEITSEMMMRLLGETGQIVGLLLAWLILVRVFTYMKEKLVVEGVHKHLDALGRLEAGFYSTPVGAGHWESIFNGLNQTTELISQRASLIKGFSSYVAKTVVDNVLKKKELKAEGELRELAILVSDLRDFTKLSNSLTAEQVVQMLNIYFANMIEVLTEHGVVLDKFIGDGILAYIEPQGSIAEANERIVKAAFAMHEKVEKTTNPKLAQLGLPELRLGVGLHTGKVVLGNIGAEAKMQYTVIGDPVNACSRLESLCKELKAGIVASKEVTAQLPSDLRQKFEDLGRHVVRGLSGELHLYGVTSLWREPKAVKKSA